MAQPNYQWRTLPPDALNKGRLNQRQQALALVQQTSSISLLIALTYLGFRVSLTPAQLVPILAVGVEIAFFCECIHLTMAPTLH